MTKKQSIKGARGAVPRPELDETPEPNEDTRSPLGVYLSLNGISVSAFAKACGVPFKSARDWVSGAVLPNVVACYEIERITKGAVPMESWIAIGKAKQILNQYRSFQPDEIKNMPTEIRGAGMALPESARKKRSKEDAQRIKAKEAGKRDAEEDPE